MDEDEYLRVFQTAYLNQWCHLTTLTIDSQLTHNNIVWLFSENPSS
jgi:hypothetical protein